MKYYHYISASKVDMLFPQVPRTLRENVSAEFGFNLGVVSGSVGAEANRFDDPIARLKVVERYLLTHDQVGSIEHPRDWFAGEMMAKAVGLWTGGGAVFFVGEVGDTVVALGGSERNLLGSTSSSNAGPGFSELEPMMEALEELVTSEAETDSALVALPTAIHERSGTIMTWDGLVRTLAHHPPSDVKQQIHFVARRLASAPAPSNVILGTPLFVAGGPADTT